MHDVHRCFETMLCPVESFIIAIYIVWSEIPSTVTILTVDGLGNNFGGLTVA